MKKFVCYFSIVIFIFLVIFYQIQRHEPSNVYDELYLSFLDTKDNPSMNDLEQFKRLEASFDKSPFGKNEQTHQEWKMFFSDKGTILIALGKKSFDKDDVVIISIVNPISVEYHTVTTYRYFKNTRKLISMVTLYDSNDNKMNEQEALTVFEKEKTTLTDEVEMNNEVLRRFFLEPWTNQNKSKFTMNDLGDLTIEKTEFN